MSALLVVNADDFGISSGATEAIVDCHLRGLVSSTSVMANMPGFDSAIALRDAAPELGFGAHLSLTAGKPVLGAERVPLLCDELGWFSSSTTRHLALGIRGEYKLQAAAELSAQMEKLEAHGFRMDHINGQSHVQLLPALFPIFEKLQRKFQIPFLRISGESFWKSRHGGWRGITKNAVVCGSRFLAGTRTNAVRTIGLSVNRMDERALVRHLRSAGPGTTEVFSHPGSGQLKGGPFQGWVADYLRSSDRIAEWSALTSEAAIDAAAGLGLVPTTFKALEHHLSI